MLRFLCILGNGLLWLAYSAVVAVVVVLGAGYWTGILV
jgi:hypothetical protein